MTAATTNTTAYDDRGQGDPALLFLPGWCGDRSVFADLLPLASRHRRVLSSDLRGHGASVGADADFGTEDLVTDAMALLDTAAVDTVVPVALSHAGWVALELRRRLGPDRVPAVVLLDWMVLGPPPGFLDALEALQRPEAWETVRGQLFGMWTHGVDVPAVHDYVASMAAYGQEAWARAGREISRAFTADPVPIEALARITPPCPTLHVYAQPGDDALLAAQRAQAEHYDWFEVHRLEARSHFPMFEAPEPLMETIERFVVRRTTSTVAA
jgi:pimeloyl-ACP methyl ester carboxylesterase